MALRTRRAKKLIKEKINSLDPPKAKKLIEEKINSLDPPKAKKLIEEKINSLDPPKAKKLIKQKIGSLEPPKFRREHKHNRLLMVGLPVAGLMVLAVYWRARTKKEHETVPEEAPTRLPFDPAMSSPREEGIMEREMPMDRSSARDDPSTVPGSPENLAPIREETNTRPSEQPIDRTHFAPGALDDKSGVMDNRPLQADSPVDPPVTDFATLVGMEVKDIDGKDLGRVESVFYHEANGVPEWVGFSVGLLDVHEVMAPLEGAAIGEQHLWLAYPKDIVEHAPGVHGDNVNDEDEKALYSYYHVRRMLAEHQGESAVGDELLKKWQTGGSETTPQRRSA